MVHRRKGGAPEDDPADPLFRIPLDEFTAARNALVARLKRAGRPGDAQAVRSLVKPSQSAWAVNQLFWRQRQAFDHLLTVGERFRAAQASQLQGTATDIRGPLDARRQALAALLRHAAGLLRDADINPGPDVMRRITSTLEALSISGGRADLPLGRLIDDVDPPGFEALTALVPRFADQAAEGGPSRVLAFQQTRPARQRVRGPAASGERAQQQQAAQAAARTALRSAERELRRARTAAQRAEAALKAVAKRARDAERTRLEAERRAGQAVSRAEKARRQAHTTAGAAEEAAQAVEDAERALAKAREDVARLGSRRAESPAEPA